MEGFSVGGYFVYPQLNKIQVKGHDVSIEPKAMDVLVFLAKHVDEVLPKERIIQAVWPDLFVTDDVLTHAISHLRKSVGLSANTPSFIQTIPKKGYRLVGPVSPVGATAHVPAEPLPAGRRFAGSPRMLLTFALLVLGGAVGLWFALQSDRKTETVALLESPLTTYPGRELEPTLSPDGTQVAFSWDGENRDNFDIYVKPVGQGDALRLTTHTRPDCSPVWAPDGKWIAFCRFEEVTAKVFLIPPLGGGERELARVLPLPRLQPPVARLLSWSADGQWLAIAHKPSPEAPVQIFGISTKSGAMKPLVPAPGDGMSDLSPSFSPDGQALAFSRVLTKGKAELYMVELDHDLRAVGVPRRLTFANRLSIGACWSWEGRRLVFSSGPSRHDLDLWAIDVGSGGDPGPAQPIARMGRHPVVCEKSKRLVFSRTSSHEDIWLLRSNEGSWSAARKFISSTREEGYPQFSPDGHRIAFNSDRSGYDEIWVCESNGDKMMQLTSLNGPQGGSPTWSPDGKQLAFDTRAHGAGDIYVIDSMGGQPRRLTDHPADDLVPTWSRDGKWIYFCSKRSGPDFQLWKMPSGGGQARQLTRKGAVTAWESPDGRFLYYSKLPVGTLPASLWRMPAEGGEEVEVVHGLTGYGAFAMTPNGIYFISQGEAPETSSVQFISFADGSRKTLTAVPEATDASLAVSPDQKRILFTGREFAESDLILIEDFR